MFSPIPRLLSYTGLQKDQTTSRNAVGLKSTLSKSPVETEIAQNNQHKNRQGQLFPKYLNMPTTHEKKCKDS